MSTITGVERYQLLLHFDSDLGFINAQVVLILRHGFSRETDYRAVQSVLNTRGGFLPLWENGQMERVNVVQSDPLYSVLLKI